MLQDIGMTPNPCLGFGVLSFAGCSGRGSGRPAGGLVVAVGVESELAEEFAGGGVDDADVRVVDELQGAGPADADVVEAAGVAEGEFAVGVDAVGADPAGVAGGLAGSGFGPGGIGGGGGGPATGAAAGCCSYAGDLVKRVVMTPGLRVG
jgi:hypothetical protein